MIDVSRRSVFLHLASLVSLCGLSTAPISAAAGQPRVIAWRRALPGTAAVRAVGRRCLAAGVTECNSLELAETLDAAVRHWGVDQGNSLRLAEVLAKIRRREFSAGDVVRVDGWVLSRSEARAYALVALSPARERNSQIPCS